jgi:hypothetical protein
MAQLVSTVFSALSGVESRIIVIHVNLKGNEHSINRSKVWSDGTVESILRQRIELERPFDDIACRPKERLTK